MFRELLGEMIKKGISKADLAKVLKISERTLKNKLNGITDFSWSEVKKIKSVVAPEMECSKLFATEQDRAS